MQLKFPDWTSNFLSKTSVWDPVVYYYAGVEEGGQKPDSGAKPAQVGIPTMMQMNLVILSQLSTRLKL